MPRAFNLNNDDYDYEDKLWSSESGCVICEQKFKDKGISNRGLDLKINTLIHKILFVYMHPMFNNLFYCIV